MASGSPPVVEAAGGLLWRPPQGGGGVEIALIHRPKYDDWSLPKGKLHAGEHVLLAAVREVAEETGFHCQPGRALGAVRYLKEGVPKRARYWAMEAPPGQFVPNLEADQLSWLSPREARAYLARDEGVLDRFLERVVATYPVLMVDVPTGQPADALTGILEAFGVTRVVAADVLGCMETMGPYARARRLTVGDEPLLSERGYDEAPAAAAARFLALVRGGEPLAAASQGRAVPGLIKGVCKHWHVKCPEVDTAHEGDFWVLHLSRGDPVELVALERFPAIV